MTEQTIQLVENKSNGIGTAGFVLALIALFFGWVPVLGWITWLLGLIFSAVGISKANKVQKGKGLSIAGLVISLLGIIFLIAAAGTVATMIGLAV